MATRAAFYSERDLDSMGILTRTTRWRLRQANNFPDMVSLSAGRKAYPAHLVDAWVAEKAGVAINEAA